jgi:hypothetical protein
MPTGRGWERRGKQEKKRVWEKQGKKIRKKKRQREEGQERKIEKKVNMDLSEFDEEEAGSEIRGTVDYFFFSAQHRCYVVCFPLSVLCCSPVLQR